MSNEIKMQIKNLTLPLSPEVIKTLAAGDIVKLSGRVFTARDAAHKRLTDALKKNEPLPVDLKNAAIYYCGPAPKRDGEIIGACGPTTSSRMDDYTPALLERGVKVMIGKGNRSKEVVSSMVKNGVVYFCAVGGAAALIAQSVTSQKVAAYEDLGCEAIYELDFKDLELIVGIDCKGNSILK